MIATCLEPMKFKNKRWQDSPSNRLRSLTRTLREGVPEAGRGAAAKGIVLMDAPDIRRTVERIMQDHSFPVPPGSWLDLTTLINFARLSDDLKFRVPVAQRLWIDAGGSRHQDEWMQVRQCGWTVKRPRKPSGYSAVDYIRNCIRRATERARSGEPVTLCLFAHSNRYSRPARQFCKTGGRLLLVGYIGYFQRRHYELSDIGAELIDIEYDCRATKLRIRESAKLSPQLGARSIADRGLQFFG